MTLVQTSQSSSSLLNTSLAEALISNVASLMSSPARLYRISLLITVLTLDTTLSWRKLFQFSVLRSQLLFTSGLATASLLLGGLFYALVKPFSPPIFSICLVTSQCQCCCTCVIYFLQLQPPAALLSAESSSNNQ